MQNLRIKLRNRDVILYLPAIVILWLATRKRG
jgi:hypothetical protein